MNQQKHSSFEQDDAALVNLVLAGEREAYDLLFRRYAPSVQRLCTRLLGTPVEAEDIVQEAALQAFLGLAHLREPARFAGWFHGIAANLARSALRRRSEHSLEVLGEEIIIHLTQSDTPPTPEEYVIEREHQEAMMLALLDLSPAHRQAIMGFYLQGYRYADLAGRLGVPVSTLKWRLFEGRKLLKRRLQALGEAPLYPDESRQRKGKHMPTADLVTLRLDSLRQFLFTRQYLAVLRDPASARVLPVSLSEAEFDTLEIAFHLRQDENVRSFPPELSHRLLESFGAQLQQVVINALAGKTLYATATVKQGARVREVDMRLVEALGLVVRTDAPISIKRALFERMAALDIRSLASPSSGEDQPAGGKVPRKLGREDRLQWEEAVRSRYTTAGRRRPEPFWERLWSMLLVSQTGALDAMAAAKLHTLDLTALFPAREVTWDAQPMVAIRLTSQREAGWLLIPPTVWAKIRRQWQLVREPQPENEPAPRIAPPAPDGLSPQQKLQVEERLAWLVELPDVQAAVLYDPAGSIAAWKGSGTQDTLRSYAGSNAFSQPSLANEGELGKQFQKVVFFAVPDGKQPLPEQERQETLGTTKLHASHPSGWRLVAFFEEPRTEEGQEETHQRFKEVWRGILPLLAQPVSEWE